MITSNVKWNFSKRYERCFDDNIWRKREWTQNSKLCQKSSRGKVQKSAAYKNVKHRRAMKFRTAPKLQSCVCQITKTQQCKVKAGFISLQSGSSNCAALTVPKRKPYLVLKPILTYQPSVTSLYLDTVKLLLAKFTLNIVPLSAVSEITPGINLNSYAAEFLGTEGLPWGKDCPAEYLFKCPQRSTPTAQHVAVILCSVWPWWSVVSGHSCFLLLCHCLSQTQRECKYIPIPSFRID